MGVNAGRWNPGDDVIIVDDSVNFHLYIFPKVVIADSGRTEGVDTLDMVISAGKKCRQGGSQAVTGSPDFTTLAMEFIDIG